MNAFICLKWVYVDGTVNTNEQWQMSSFPFGSVFFDVGN